MPLLRISWFDSWNIIFRRGSYPPGMRFGFMSVLAHQIMFMLVISLHESKGKGVRRMDKSDGLAGLKSMLVPLLEYYNPGRLSCPLWLNQYWLG